MSLNIPKFSKNNLLKINKRSYPALLISTLLPQVLYHQMEKLKRFSHAKVHNLEIIF